LRFVSGLPGLRHRLSLSPKRLRESLKSLCFGPLRYRQGPLRFDRPLPALDDQSRGEGGDDDQEHQGADTYSPAGTVALHDRDLDSDCLKAPIVGLPVPSTDQGYEKPKPFLKVRAGTLPLAICKNDGEAFSSRDTA
jgi:hypothetical protein